jgi:hypothetical protein
MSAREIHSLTILRNGDGSYFVSIKPDGAGPVVTKDFVMDFGTAMETVVHFLEGDDEAQVTARGPDEIPPGATKVETQQPEQSRKSRQAPNPKRKSPSRRRP